MSASILTPPPAPTLADLVERLGSIPLKRIRLIPAPGTATEQDVVNSLEGDQPLCELIDGTLVEKPMGFYESRLAAVLIRLIEGFLEQHDLGITLGADATMRLVPGLVRLPDVSFFSWDHFPGRRLPREPVPDLVPDLAVEIISEGNTPGEMARKLQEYLEAGVRLVWYVDSASRTAVVHPAAGQTILLGEDGTLDGSEVLPGLQISLREWFARAGERVEIGRSDAS